MAPRPVRLVVLDLDGTLLATEHAVSRAAADVLAAYGAELTPEASAAALGRRPLEAWAAVAAALNSGSGGSGGGAGALPPEVTPERLLAESEARLVEGWKDVAPLPGAKRLVEHLRTVAEERRKRRKGGGGVESKSSSSPPPPPPLVLALVTSTPARTLALKTGPGSLGEAFGRDSWDVVVCGDDVERGKPHPKGLLLAAERASELLLRRRKEAARARARARARAAGREEEREEDEEEEFSPIRPSECLVIEDSPAGAEAAVAAGMRCVLVPSLREKEGGKSVFPPVVAEEEAATEGEESVGAVVAKIPTLLAFDPLPFSLPPFTDAIAGGKALRLDPLLRLEGTVVSGFGRGSAELGIPTANLDGEALARGLDGSVSGIFAAFARVFFDDDGEGGGEGGKEQHLSKKIFPAVLSVGYNPQFDNGERVFFFSEKSKENERETLILFRTQAPFLSLSLPLSLTPSLPSSKKLRKMNNTITKINTQTTERASPGSSLNPGSSPRTFAARGCGSSSRATSAPRPGSRAWRSS